VTAPGSTLLERTGLFDALTYAQATHVQRLSSADFLAQVSSWNWITNLAEATRRAALDDVGTLVGHRTEVAIPYRTEIYWTRRNGGCCLISVGLPMGHSCGPCARGESVSGSCRRRRDLP
jgi:hypothetical protein